MKFSFANNTEVTEASVENSKSHNGAIKCVNIGYDDRDEKMLEVLSSPKGLGTIKPGKNTHFYTKGAFDLVQLVLYILRQTGPADVMLSSYSISEDSLRTFHRMVERGELRSIRFLIDNRVRSISPKPFGFLVTSFPDDYRCLALHAKVAVIGNEDWKISVVGSQNATHNPKLERGIIHTDPSIYEFDKMILEDAFNEGTT